MVSAQESPKHLELHAIASAYADVYGFSGTIRVADSSHLFEKSYGLADRSAHIQNTPATRFSINSISKTFTAAAILLLSEQEKLDLNTPIADYVPSLTATWKDTVTVEHLLTHTSGLPRESGIQAHEALTFEEQLRLVNKLRPLFAAGSQYGYSNVGFILLGAIIENTSGMSYSDFIAQNVLEALKLEDTGYLEDGVDVDRLAIPYRVSADGLEQTQRTKHRGENAGGGLYSTPADLHRFIEGLLAHQLLSAQSVDRMFHPHVQSEDGAYEGYAWSIKQFGDQKIYFAAGSGYGTKSAIIYVPTTKTFIGIASNWVNTPILDLLRDLYLSSNGKPVQLPSVDELADPNDYQPYLGNYRFDAEALRIHLGADHPIINLQAIDGKLFLNDELMAQGQGKLQLTYTDEMAIILRDKQMIIKINGNELTGWLME